jgi:hypothetical protein
MTLTAMAFITTIIVGALLMTIVTDKCDGGTDCDCE